MSLLARLINVLRTLSHKFLGHFEDPISQLDLDITDLDKKLIKAREDLAPVLGETKRLNMEKEQQTKEVQELQEKLESLLRNNEDIKAREVLIGLKAKKANLAYLESTLDSNTETELLLRETIADGEIKLQELKTYRLGARARYRSAKAKESINKLIVNNDNDKDSVKVSAVEDVLVKQEDAANGYKQLADERRKSSVSDIDAELAEMKKRLIVE